MNLSDFLYDLPAKLIAQHPVVPRDSSRLLLLPEDGNPEHRKFMELPGLLKAGDLLVVNDSRVIPVRLPGKRGGGGKAEVFLLQPTGGNGCWEALVKPAKKLKTGSMVFFSPGKAVEIVGELGDGRVAVRSISDDTIEDIMRETGKIPLPPYINREAEEADRRRYQTVYARKGTSVAAPTAGLHFTPRVLAAVRKRGVETAAVRLDVGPGTFKPVKTERVEDHVMHEERYFILPETATAVNRAIEEKRRIVAVGTTVTRCLEDQALRFDRLRAGEFTTDLFILPGFRFNFVSGLLTNFHLPGSTLLMLVSAFAGRQRVLDAYSEAISMNYRFYSYGDAMFTWRRGKS